MNVCAHTLESAAELGDPDSKQAWTAFNCQCKLVIKLPEKEGSTFNRAVGENLVSEFVAIFSIIIVS